MVKGETEQDLNVGEMSFQDLNHIGNEPRIGSDSLPFAELTHFATTNLWTLTCTRQWQ